MDWFLYDISLRHERVKDTSVFIDNFEYISHLFLGFLLFALNKLMFAGIVE